MGAHPTQETRTGRRTSATGSTVLAALLLASTVTTNSALAQVDVYRWVDQNGTVNFSDTRSGVGDQQIRLHTQEPTPAAVEAHGRLMDQQMELITLLEASRQSRALDLLERRRQDVELARARLALEQERNAADYYDDSPRRGVSWGYPVRYDYRFQRRHGFHNYSGSGHGYGRPTHLPARLSHPHSRPPSRPGGGGHGGSGQTLSKPFITNR